MVCVVIAASSAAAHAQEQNGTAEHPGVTRPAGSEHLFTHHGVSVQGGGGVTNFTSGRTRDFTDVGGYWDVRAVLGTRSYAALEAAYVGNAQNIDAPGLDPNASLVGHGAEGDLRLQLPMMVESVLLEPFAFGGLGWMRYGLTNDNFNTSIVNSADNVLTVPFGAGVAVGYRGLMVDARFTYRQTFDDDNLFPVPSESGWADLQTWAAGLMLGFEF
jgi:hypothetical protein